MTSSKPIDASAVQTAHALSSMTGFASTQGSFDVWSWSMDIRSVNGRGLDIRCRMPDWIDGLEPEIRKLFQGCVARGTVTVSIRVQQDDRGAGLRLDREMLSQVLSLLREIEHVSETSGLPLKPISATDIATFRGVLTSTETQPDDTAPLKDAILEAAKSCLDDFVTDRNREGNAVGAVISDQIDRLDGLVQAAKVTVGNREDATRQAMDRALARLIDATHVPDEARLHQELALIAVKSDVTEELDRLEAHIAAARELLVQKGAVGRKFDFLMQEFNREANTLCSKSQNTELTAVGLDLKALIDQMREQVQNIE